MVVKGLEAVLVGKIKRAREKDKEVVKVIKERKKGRVKVLRNEEWKIERDLVLKKGKMYVLKDKELKIEIIQLHHNMLVVG